MAKQIIVEGQTATNPQTGQKIVYQGGKWYPVGAGGAAAPTGPSKAMPGGVVNKLNEDIDAVGTASAMNARMEPYRRDLDSRKVDLGPVRNLFMNAQNFAGWSTPASREFATFRSDLEKMRNDSLRLNKGVQTEGDAIRAWNELFKNMNDEKLVAERLAQIQQYNDQAIRLKKGVVDNTRSQYGLGPYDYSKVETPRNFFGNSRQPPPKPKTPPAKYLGTE